MRISGINICFTIQLPQTFQNPKGFWKNIIIHGYPFIANIRKYRIYAIHPENPWISTFCTCVVLLRRSTFGSFQTRVKYLQLTNNTESTSGPLIRSVVMLISTLLYELWTPEKKTTSREEEAAERACYQYLTGKNGFVYCLCVSKPPTTGCHKTTGQNRALKLYRKCFYEVVRVRIPSNQTFQ